MKQNVVGPAIKQARENLGWSPQMLAFLLASEDWQTDGQTLEQIENQELAISDTQIFALSKILEVPFEEFFQTKDAIALRREIERTARQNFN